MIGLREGLLWQTGVTLRYREWRGYEWPNFYISP